MAALDAGLSNDGTASGHGWLRIAGYRHRPFGCTSSMRGYGKLPRAWAYVAWQQIDVFLEELAASGIDLDRERAGELITGRSVQWQPS